MAYTTFLALPLLEPSQSQPDVVINDAFGKIDQSGQGWEYIDASAVTFPYSMGVDSFNRVINVYGLSSSNHEVIIQDRSFFYNVINDSPKDLTVKTATGSGVVIPAWQKAQIYCDGANVFNQITAFTNEIAMVDGINLVLGSGLGNKIGTETFHKIGFLGAVPVSQQPAITNPTGGTTVDLEARAAIDSIISVLQSFGFTA